MDRRALLGALPAAALMGHLRLVGIGVARVDDALDLGRAKGRLLFMQSNGGLTEAGRFQGKDAILSGPAGGIVGMVRTGEAAGFEGFTDDGGLLITSRY